METIIAGPYQLLGVALGFLVVLAISVVDNYFKVRKVGKLVARLDDAILDLYHNRDKTLSNKTWDLLEERYGIK